MLTVKIRGSVPCRCEGCKWLHLPRPQAPDEPPYCTNANSIWYLQTTGARCSEWDYKDEEDAEQ